MFHVLLVSDIFEIIMYDIWYKPGKYFKSAGDITLQFWVLNLFGEEINMEFEKDTITIRVRIS